MVVALVVFALQAVLVSVPAQATHDGSVTLTITKVRNIGDEGVEDNARGEADFYAVVTIDGTQFDSKAVHVDDDDDVSPNWAFPLDASGRPDTIPIVIEVWEHDGCDPVRCGVSPDPFGESDDQADVDPGGGSNVDLTLDRLNGAWSGDTTGGCSEGNDTSDGDRRVAVCWDIAIDGVSIGRPVAVTVTRVTNVGDEGIEDNLRGEADIYAGVTIFGATLDSKPVHVDDDDDILPFWVFTNLVSPTAPNSIPISIEIWDHDDCDHVFCGGDDKGDVDPTPGNDNVDISVNRTTGAWSGDTSAACSQGDDTGDGDRRVRVCWDVSVLSASGDADGDALLDGWEAFGLDRDGDGSIDVPLNTMGANAQRKDLYIEIDCLVSDADGDGALTSPVDHSHCPMQAAMQSVVQAFANAPVGNPDGTTGVQMHLDTGPLYGAGVVTTVAGTAGVTGTFGDRGGGGTQIPEAPNMIIDWDGATGNPATNFYTLKTANFNSLRDLVFRYNIWGHQTNMRRAANDCTSGVAEDIPGNDFIVSLGGLRDTNADGTGDVACWTADANGFSVGSQAEQAGTFMHELGHVIGLQHGGSDGVNNKPNYISVMNYSFQSCSVPNAPAALPGGCDYSRDDLSDLNERTTPFLDECAGVDNGLYGLGPVDFDGDGTQEGASCAPVSANVSIDVNGDNDCVGAGTNGNRDTSPSGDDVIVGQSIKDGPDFKCDTGAASDDAQDKAVGTFQAEPLTSFDDWDGLFFAFRTHPTFQNGIADPVEDEPDPETIEEARAELAELVRPDLSVTKSGPSDALAGDTLTYTIGTSNVGRGPALDVTLSDTLPDGSEQAFSYEVVQLGSSVSESPTFDVSCDTADGTVLTNTVSATGFDMIQNPETTTGNNSASVSTTVHAPVLTLAKTATATVNAGEAITYRMTYENTGSGDAVNVVITDVVPADVYYSEALDLGAGPRPDAIVLNGDGTRTLRWDIGLVSAASGPLVVEYTARPSLLLLPGTGLSGTATLTFENPNGCTYEAVLASASTTLTEVVPSGNPGTIGYWRNHPSEWTAEMRARVQATDQRYDGADGSAPDGQILPAELTAALSPGGNQPKVLTMQLLATYFNLATRRINASTLTQSPPATRLGLLNVRESGIYAIDTLAMPVDRSTRARYSDATAVLDSINNGNGNVY